MSGISARVRGWRRQAVAAWTHPSNKSHRLQIARQIVAYEWNSARKRPTRVTFADDLVIEAEKVGDSSSRVVFERVPDWPAMPIWEAWLQPGDLFVDVGANVGLYTLLASRRGSRVIAVEPAADMAARLRRHLVLNQMADVVVEECALMDRDGRVSLDGPDPNRRVASQGLGGHEVRAGTLDGLVGGQRLSGVKIDVEGNERLVLQGATAVLEDGVELLQLEWNESSLIALGQDRRPVADILTTAGFKLYQVDRHTLNGPRSEPGFGGDVFAARGTAEPFLRSWITRS